MMGYSAPGDKGIGYKEMHSVDFKYGLISFMPEDPINNPGACPSTPDRKNSFQCYGYNKRTWPPRPIQVFLSEHAGMAKNANRVMFKYEGEWLGWPKDSEWLKTTYYMKVVKCTEE